MDCVTTLIATTIAFIAVQQYLLAREKFKLDLFEKRFAIFKATEIFINLIVGARGSSAGNFSEWHKQFSFDTQTACFLFDSEMAAFIDDLVKKGNRVTIAYGLKSEPQASTDSVIIEALKDAKRIQDEFITIQGQLRDKFSPYLKFANWKYGFLLGLTE
jgi:hypothetical protein